MYGDILGAPTLHKSSIVTISCITFCADTPSCIEMAGGLYHKLHMHKVCVLAITVNLELLIAHDVQLPYIYFYQRLFWPTMMLRNPQAVRPRTYSLAMSPNPTIQIVAHAATPMRGTMPRKKPKGPELARMRFAADAMVGFDDTSLPDTSDCISTRRT
jgi:hypothetical protein